MMTLTLNGRTVEAEQGWTILRAAKEAGLEIPHLCFHPAFDAEGSCRLCVVEVEGAPKLELACSTLVREGMVVRTETPRVVEARKSVLEFLLAEHPMDCPVCDQAGECKLQDYYAAFSLEAGAYIEDKRRRDKRVALGKNLLLDRERCVLCTRCVRFVDSVTKTSELGVFERGVHSEIGIFEGRPVDNNYSGCLAEICPVGAITDLDFRFRTRQWFLEAGETLCPMCGRGCNVVLDRHPGHPRQPGTQRILRVRARRNDRVNGHWICDLGRYGYSFLQEDRCLAVSGRAAGDFGLKRTEDAVSHLAARLKALPFRGSQARAVVVLSDWLSNEELFLARTLFRQDLGLSRVHLIVPPGGSDDGFLLTAERSPNRRGAEGLGFRPEEPRLADLGREADLLLVFGTALGKRYAQAEIVSSLAGVKFKVLFTPHEGGLMEAFDLVIPTALPAEKHGTFTNCMGEAQAFDAAFEPAGRSWPEWKILSELGKGSGLNHGFYGRLRGIGDVRGVMS